MAYQIKVKDVNNVVHAVEVAESAVKGKSLQEILQMAANLATAAVGVVTLHSHGKKEDN